MYRWHSLLGKFSVDGELITFHGETTQYLDQPFASVGNAVCDQRFSGGQIKGSVSFAQVSEHSACQLIISYQPATNTFVTAGIGNDTMFVIRTFSRNDWTRHASGGDRSALKSGRQYDLVVTVRGSRIALTVDGVDVLVTDLPFVIPRNQVGIWFQDIAEVRVAGFSVEPEMPSAFVVMQFTEPFNALYAEVIRPICEEFEIESIRADEAYGPGIIIADIARQIAEAKLVIAEITPANPNVYYEVGYAHAMNKPTILIAEKGTQLPFDVSPFRILFYENSIEGKRRIDEGFRKHLQALELAPALIAR